MNNSCFIFMYLISSIFELYFYSRCRERGTRRTIVFHLWVHSPNAFQGWTRNQELGILARSVMEVAGARALEYHFCLLGCILAGSWDQKSGDGIQTRWSNEGCGLCRTPVPMYSISCLRLLHQWWIDWAGMWGPGSVCFFSDLSWSILY